MDSQRRCQATIHHDHYTNQCQLSWEYPGAHAAQAWTEMDADNPLNHFDHMTTVWIDYRWYTG